MYFWLFCIGWAPVVLWGILRHGQGAPSGRTLIIIGVVWLVVGVLALGYAMLWVGARGEPPEL